jgi:hypothetical protein
MSLSVSNRMDYHHKMSLSVSNTQALVSFKKYMPPPLPYFKTPGYKFTA